MAYIYLVRHAQSASNSKNDYTIIDTPLTEIGIRQAELTAEYIIERMGRGLMPFFICSPSLRAIETAMPLTFLKKVPVYLSLNAHEYNGTGNVEMPYLTKSMMIKTYGNRLKIPGDMPELWDSHPNETQNQFIQRIGGLLSWLKTRPQDEVIVLVTHSYVIQELVSKALDVPKEPSPIWNASISLLESNRGKFRAIQLNNVEHLPEELQQWHIINN